MSPILEKENGPEFLEHQFVEFIGKIAERKGLGESHLEARLGGNFRADLLVDSDSRTYIIECKRSSPQTRSRIDSAAEQLKEYARRVKVSQKEVVPVLAMPSTLSKDHQARLTELGIAVWDSTWIAEQSRILHLESEATMFIGHEPIYAARSRYAADLSDRLDTTSPGRQEWSAYQRLCLEIFEYLFCPPLSSPIGERPNRSETNRRDFILPNYTENGFWSFLRREYRADYVVCDSKNYSGRIKKNDVLQVSNYLQRHGVGLFGIIVCRKGASESASYTLREQWILHDKMIVVVRDEDVQQMLSDKASEYDPSVLIRQKIEDFRLGV